MCYLLSVGHRSDRPGPLGPISATRKGLLNSMWAKTRGPKLVARNLP